MKQAAFRSAEHAPSGRIEGMPTGSFGLAMSGFAGNLLRLQRTIGNRAVQRLFSSTGAIATSQGSGAIQRRTVEFTDGRSIETEQLTQDELERTLKEAEQKGEAAAQEQLRQALLHGEHKNGEKLTTPYGRDEMSQKTAYFRQKAQIDEHRNIATFKLVPKQANNGLQPQFVTLPSLPLGLSFKNGRKERRSNAGHSEKVIYQNLENILKNRGIKKEDYRIDTVYTERAPCERAEVYEDFGYSEGCKDFLRTVKLNADDPLPKVEYHFETGRDSADQIGQAMGPLRNDQTWKPGQDEKKQLDQDIAFFETGKLPLADHINEHQRYRRMTAYFNVAMKAIPEDKWTDMMREAKKLKELLDPMASELLATLQQINHVKREMVAASDDPTKKLKIGELRPLEQKYANLYANFRIPFESFLSVLMEHFLEDEEGRTLMLQETMEQIHPDINDATKGNLNQIYEEELSKTRPVNPGNVQRLPVKFDSSLEEPQPVETTAKKRMNDNNRSTASKPKYALSAMEYKHLMYIIQEEFKTVWTSEQYEQIKAAVAVSMEGSLKKREDVRLMVGTPHETTILGVVSNWVASRNGEYVRFTRGEH